MSAPIVYAANRLEVGIVTAGAATGMPVSRIFDRFKLDRWRDAASGTRDIILDLGTSGLFVDAVLGIEHNLDGITVTVAHDDNPTFTSPTTLASGAIDADPFILTGTASDERYWRFRMASTVNPPELGELFFSLGATLPGAPRPVASPNASGSMVTQETEAGAVIAAVRGDPFWVTEWSVSELFDRTARDTFLALWRDDLQIGARPCFLVDDEDTLRFAHVLSFPFEGAGVPQKYVASLQLREALG